MNEWTLLKHAVTEPQCTIRRTAAETFLGKKTNTEIKPFLGSESSATCTHLNKNRTKLSPLVSNWSNFSSDECGTFGKESVSDGDPVGGLGGSSGTARLPGVISLQLTGQCEHGCPAAFCPRRPSPYRTSANMPADYTESTEWTKLSLKYVK